MSNEEIRSVLSKLDDLLDDLQDNVAALTVILAADAAPDPEATSG